MKPFDSTILRIFSGTILSGSATSLYILNAHEKRDLELSEIEVSLKNYSYEMKN